MYSVNFPDIYYYLKSRNMLGIYEDVDKLFEYLYDDQDVNYKISDIVNVGSGYVYRFINHIFNKMINNYINIMYYVERLYEEFHIPIYLPKIKAYYIHYCYINDINPTKYKSIRKNKDACEYIKILYNKHLQIFTNELYIYNIFTLNFKFINYENLLKLTDEFISDFKHSDTFNKQIQANSDYRCELYVNSL